MFFSSDTQFLTFSTSRLLLLCCAAALLAGPVHGDGAGSIVTIDSIDTFEASVLNNQDVWLVVFTVVSRDEKKTKGVNVERCDEVMKNLEPLAAELKDIGVKVGVVDVDELGPIASEMNVRKRTVPKALLFKVRIRDGSEVKVEALADPQGAKKLILEELADNKKRDDGSYEKIMMAVGGGEL